MSVLYRGHPTNYLHCVGMDVELYLLTQSVQRLCCSFREGISSNWDQCATIFTRVGCIHQCEL